MRYIIAVVLAASMAVPSLAQRDLAGTPEIKLALDRLEVLGSVLMIAAHPDDENTAVLAYWARGCKLRAGYLSCTRGEGGQNLIGSEQGDLLGLIRTQELLAARRIDGAEQFFTRAIDFGFSKTPAETIEKWGKDETLGDMVWVIRQYQPDVIVLRFTGTPRDGHGHHQASAILGKEAFAAAGDPNRFPEQLKYVKPWQAKRLVWNGFTFTPEQEKEAAAMKNRIEVDTGAYDPVLGKSYAEIAGISRSQHRSQGMGAAEHRGPSKNFFTPVSGDIAQKDLFDGVDITWNRVPGGAKIGALIERADRAFVPEHPERAIPALLEARPLVAGLASQGNLWGKRKLAELDEAVALCAGLWLDADADRYAVTPAGKLRVTVTALDRSPFAFQGMSVHIAGEGVEQDADLGSSFADNQPVTKPVDLTLPADASVSQPFWLIKPPHHNRYTIDDQRLIGRADPLPAMTATFRVKAGSEELSLARPVLHRYIDHVQGERTRPLTVVPAVSIDLPETIAVFPNPETRRFEVQVKANVPQAAGELHFEAPAGWHVEPATRPFQLKATGELQDLTFMVKPETFAKDEVPPPAHFQIYASVNGVRIASGTQVIAYPHIPMQTVFYPSAGSFRKSPLNVLAKKVGYIMGAGDEVPTALRQMGCDVTLLGEDDLNSGDLSRFDAIVTGVRAYNVRADLRANQPRLLDYVRGGGTMVVQYNVLENFRRGGDTGLEGLGPYPLTLGRDRVTVEESPVEFLNMKNPLLRAPNKISAKDFEGWVQERGLYFASQWDPHYETVIETHDPSEKPLAGGMLFTKYGKGAYVFTSYSWFRQLPAGVPGAYRIFANLLSAGKAQ